MLFYSLSRVDRDVLYLAGAERFWCCVVQAPFFQEVFPLPCKLLLGWYVSNHIQLVGCEVLQYGG